VSLDRAGFKMPFSSLKHVFKLNEALFLWFGGRLENTTLLVKHVNVFGLF